MKGQNEKNPCKNYSTTTTDTTTPSTDPALATHTNNP